jgi:uncharacterized small protein (DUF1192 family)
MDKKENNYPNYQKKIYTRLSKSDLSSLNPKEALNPLQEPMKQKKIVATTISQNIREEFKKTFVPILVEVFELRQQITNHLNQDDGNQLFSHSTLSINEITARLNLLKKEIEETKRWCEGVQLQIEKGLIEAQKSPACQAEPHREKIKVFKPKQLIKKLMAYLKSRDNTI